MISICSQINVRNIYLDLCRSSKVGLSRVGVELHRLAQNKTNKNRKCVNKRSLRDKVNILLFWYFINNIRIYITPNMTSQSYFHQKLVTNSIFLYRINILLVYQFASINHNINVAKYQYCGKVLLWFCDPSWINDIHLTGADLKANYDQ